MSLILGIDPDSPLQGDWSRLNNCVTTTIFGMADHSSTPGNGWTLISTTSLLDTHKAALIAFYNSNGGLPVISSWTSSNCCWALSSTARLAIGSTHAYPANSDGECCSCESYSGTYKFSQSGTVITTLSTETFGSTTGCSDNNNPGIFFK